MAHRTSPSAAPLQIPSLDGIRAASVLLVVGLPMELAGFLAGPATQLMWIPMAAFEVPLGVWLLIKGARAPLLPHATASTEQSTAG